MIFLDTSYLVSLENDKDSNHEKAVRLNEEIAKGKFGRIVVSDYIFDETVTVTFRRTRKLNKAILVGERLFSFAEIKYVDEKTFADSWNFFRKQKSTELSFTDCTTLVLMQSNGINNIATFDEDFQKIQNINCIGL